MNMNMKYMNMNMNMSGLREKRVGTARRARRGVCCLYTDLLLHRLGLGVVTAAVTLCSRGCNPMWQGL